MHWKWKCLLCIFHFQCHCLVMPFCAVIFDGWLSTCDHRQLLPWAWAVGVHYFHRMNWSRVTSPARVKALSLPLHLCQVFMDSFCIVAVAAGHSNEYKIHEYFAAFTMTSLYRLVFFQHPQLWLTSSFSGLYCCISSCLCVLVIIQRDTNKPRQYIHEKRLISNQRNVSDPTVLIWWILKQGEQLASKVNLKTNSWDILLWSDKCHVWKNPRKPIRRWFVANRYKYQLWKKSWQLILLWVHQ